MKTSTVSLRRRNLMIAGLAGAAMPGALLAGECSITALEPSAPSAVGAVLANASGGKLIVSGRVVEADCSPLFGARVEAWHDGSPERASVTTDADGRFMLATAAAAHGGALQIRVSHGERRLMQQRYFTQEPGMADALVARLQRDDTGILRTTLGLTLA